MDLKTVNRIEFYSISDMANGHSLRNAEKLLNAFDSDSPLTTNDLFEYYNVKLYFENNLFLTTWTEEIKIEYSKIVDNSWNLLKDKLIKIHDSNFEKILNELDFSYKKNCWELINDLSVYKKLSKSKFKEVLEQNPNQIRNILSQRRIVIRFDKEIRNFLLTYEETAELLLSKYEQKQSDTDVPEYYFPKNLSLTDKENIINSYLENKNANLNYIRLIENSKNSNEIKLSAKTKLKAKKKSSELNNDILEGDNAWNIRVQVGFDKDQKEPVLYNHTQEKFEATYSEVLIDELKKNNLKLFDLFKYLFVYTDETSLITLVSKKNEMDVMERIFMKSKNAYETGESFTRKKLLSVLQLLIFDSYLKKNGNNIENLINSFVKYLNDLVFPTKILFEIRDSGSSFLEKIRTLFPDFEFLLKQYKTYTEEGYVDLELIQISSESFRFSDVKSKSKIKYIYSDNNLILKLKFLFFSDQSSLYYTDKYKSKYNNLFDLINQEDLTIDDFSNYQKNSIKELIKDGYLKINQSKYVEIKEISLIYIIRQLHKDGVLNYWNYPKFVRDEIDVLIKNKSVFVKNTLLTEYEKNYFNFYLNKKEFTNGYDLRNKYLHGTNTLSESQHQDDYYLLLKIIILTLLKIEDDILIWKKNYSMDSASSAE